MEFKEIIDTLTTEQKIAIVSDPWALSEIQLPEGFARIKIEAIDSENNEHELLPSYLALGYTWNPSLAQQAFACKSEIAIKNEANVLISPRATTKASPLTGGISEDPYINAVLLSSFEKGVAMQGALSCVKTGFDKIDIKNLDRKPSPRAINNYYFSSFVPSKSCAFSFSHIEYKGEYAKINTERLNTFLHGQVSPRKGFVFCHDCPPEAAVAQLNEGNILVAANSNGIRSALNRFKDIYGKVEHGEIDSSNLEEAIDNCSAMSFAQLDQAVNNVLSLSATVAKIKAEKTLTNQEKILSDAAAQSIVLLENKGALPLHLFTSKVSIIGGEAHMDFMQGMEKAFSKKSAYSAICRVGYKTNGEQTDELEKFALNAASHSNAIVLLLGHREEKSLILPANQLALIDKLAKLKKLLIAVIVGEDVVDVGFNSKVSGLLVCPSLDKYSAEALTDILVGKLNPSGKLINTFYDNSKEYYKNVKDYRNACSMKVGVFNGYRYYESAYIPVKYPFGHGLSYTKFSYSKLRIKGNRIKFRVKNTGKVSGSEVAQIYISKKGGILRPEKELKAFCKISLKKGQSKTVKIVLTKEQLSIFNQGKSIVEKGPYDIYVGSSVRDLRLHGKMNVSGIEVLPSKQKLIDYVPDYTNILASGYAVAPVKRKIFAGKKKRKFGFTSIIFSLSLALVLLFALSPYLPIGIKDAIPSTIFSCIPWALIIGCPALFLLGATFVVIGFLNKRKAKIRYGLVCNGKPPKEQKPVKRQSFRALFDSLYSPEEEVEVAKTEATSVITIANEEYIGSYSPDITFNDVCESLARFMTESGISADKDFARKILSAFSASRFIILPSKDLDLTNRFLKTLSKFFAGGLFFQSEEDAKNSADLISVAHGTTAFSNALEECKKDRDTINLISFNTKDISEMAKIFAPFLKCSESRSKVESFIYTDGKTNKVSIYPNLWFVLCTDSDCNYISNKIGFTDSTCILNLDITLCHEKSDKTSFTPLNFYQFQKMEQKIMSSTNTQMERYSLDEDRYWKKFDRIQEYLNKRVGHTFSNKFNLSLERYVAVFLACEGEEEVAFDLSVACKILITALGLVSDNLNEEGGLVEQLDIIFGDSATEETKKIISICS